ncbi:MAG: GYD domain-containing protein [candidate division Zixibacteria bacterium]|nr:GYD domain-containing protein [candidate division Zixibacteria bacterium]
MIEVATKLKRRVREESKWLQAVRERCPKVKWLAHYALLGQWDFMDIYEAPDEETAAIVSLMSRAHGAHQVESWTAIPNNRLMEIADAIEATGSSKTE